MAKGEKPSNRGDFEDGEPVDMTQEKWSMEEVIEAIHNSHGSMAGAARALNGDRTTMYLYRKRYPEVRRALEEARASYKDDCAEYAKDNHLAALLDGSKEATAYELAKLEPKPDSINIDPNKLTLEEIATLRRLLDKGKPDGPSAA